MRMDIDETRRDPIGVRTRLALLFNVRNPFVRNMQRSEEHLLLGDDISF